MSSRSRATFWVTPAVAVILGAAYVVAAGLNGQIWLGVGLFGLMVVFAAALVLSSRWSETVRGLLDRRDERLVRIDLQATALTGTVLIVAVIAGALVEIAHGRSGAPYSWLGALAGLTYLASVVLLRLRG
jgi:hypothetical protein